MRLAMLAMVSATALLLSACSQGSEEDRVRATMSAWFGGVAASDGRACRFLSQRTRRRLVTEANVPWASTCEDVIASVDNLGTPGSTDALRRLKIHKVHIHRDRAEIYGRDVTLPPELRAAATNDPAPTVLRRIHGTWVLDELH